MDTNVPGPVPTVTDLLNLTRAAGTHYRLGAMGNLGRPFRWDSRQVMRGLCLAMTPVPQAWDAVFEGTDLQVMKPRIRALDAQYGIAHLNWDTCVGT